MGLGREKWQVLIRALSAVYHEREKIQTPAFSEKVVMEHIRFIQPLSYRQGYVNLLEPMLWKFVPVVCLLFFILVIIMMKYPFTPDSLLMGLFVADPVTYPLAKALLM